jgi:hypothetical protein
MKLEADEMNWAAGNRTDRDRATKHGLVGDVIEATLDVKRQHPRPLSNKRHRACTINSDHSGYYFLLYQSKSLSRERICISETVFLPTLDIGRHILCEALRTAV